MIPILYDKTGNAKITNLTDCIQCIVTEERNGMFEAELVYSVHSSNSDKLIRGNIIVADANDTLKGQRFRIYKITKPINGRIKILARHISFDMARDVVTGLVIDNQSCEYALNKLFSSSQFSQRFTGHSDIVNSQSTVINGTTHILKAIVGVEGSIIDTFGTSPEILRDNYDFYIYENRGHDNGVTIEYGKNLTGLNLDTDDSNMITRIRAIAKYRDENQEEVIVVSSPEFIDSPYINNYETPFIQEIDFSSHFKDDDIPTPIRLKTLAENYFVNNKCDLPSENATISFIPLSKCVGYEGIQDKISLCDTVTVIDYRYNLTTKVKVIKVSYNTLKERYENMEVGEPRSRLGDIISNSMNTVKGEKGDKGDKGDKGEQGTPGNIGDFPDDLPTTPTLTSSLYGFASIELSWTFESQPYYTYELYASRIENFTPNEFDLLFEGKGSTFLFQAKPNETWYFRVRAVNSHGRATNFSSQVTVTTTKIDDLSNYVENMAIGEALIGTLSLDRGWVGTLKGNYIDAKQLSVTDGNGKRTLFIDSFGNVSLDVTELKISSKKPATADDVEDLENKFNEDIEDLENKFNEDIEKITVTERNLVKNSAFLYGANSWSFAANVTLDNTKLFNGHPSCKSSQTGLTTDDWRGCINYNLPSKPTDFKKGETYTFSCYYYVESKTSIDNGIRLELKGKILNSTNETVIDSVAVSTSNITENNWTRISKTITLTQDYYNCCIRAFVFRNGIAWFTDFKLEKNNKVSQWTPAFEDNETYVDNLIVDLQTQLDGKIETYSQNNDPSTSWTATEKANHEGDIWYNTSTKNTYRWNGTTWVLLQNAEAQSAKEIAQTKAQVFTGQPTVPYYKGDLWITALDGTGVVKTCIATRTSGSYTANDWKETLKYTDNTLANQLQTKFNELAVGGINLLRNGSFENGLNNWTIHDMNSGGSNKSVTSASGGDWIPVGKKVLQIRGTSTQGRYGVQSTDVILIPNTKYTISGYCAGHRVNALQINVRDLGNNSANIHTINIAPVSGGATLDKWYRIETTFTTTSNTRYGLNLYAVDFGDNGHAWFEDLQLQQGTKATAWTSCPEDTDTYIDNLVADLQGQIDGKVQTYAQSTDPSTSWTTVELKTQHAGDIWYDTDNKTTYRWNGNSWVKLNNKEAEEASQLAQTKAQVFTSQPTPPYKKGDLWVTALDGTGIVKTCIKDRTSGSYTASEWVENLKYTDDTLAEQVQEELDNLSIGGRNLVKNSAFLYGKNSWNFNTNVTLDTSKTFNGHPSCKSSQSGLTEDDWRGCVNYNLPSKPTDFKKGEIYTFSCYYYVEDKTSVDKGISLEVKGKTLNSTSDVVINSVSVSVDNITENNWTRISKTITLTQDYYNCYIYAFVTRNGTAWFADFKLEKGNKITDWTPAPEDTNSIINDAIKDLPTIDDVEDAKDSAIIASKIETIKQSYNILKSEYNKNIQQSEIIYKNSYLEGTAKTNLNTAITNYKTAFTAVTSARDSIVNANTITTSQANAWNTAITNIQTSTDTLAKRVQEAQTYIDTAIYNASVDYTDKAIPDALTGYAKTSYVDDAMEQAINDAKDGMVSSTDLTINNTEILMSAASMGQYNLLRNSDFRNEFDGWSSWGITSPHFREITTSDQRAMNGENNAFIYSNSATVGNLGLGNYQEVVLKTDSTYTISYWVNCVNSTMRVQIENIDSNNEKTTLAGKGYTNINGNGDRNTWKFDSITFTTPSDSSKVRVVFIVTNCTNSSYKVLLVKPMLVSGNKAQAWTGHPDEIYVGVVSITEKKGLMVEHSNVNTRTVMSADGFSIEDNNGDVLAWLSSKEQWTELNVERIYAANIDNVYTKHKTLYVNHSYVGSSDGTAERPFSSFNDLNQFLKLTPTINGHVNINVLSEGTITEEFVLEGLKGSGTLNVTISNNAIFQGENTREAGIKFVDVQLTINIETSATYIGFNHGVLLYNCGVTNITGLILNVSGYGVLCNNTNTVIHHVDFCDSYCCIGSTNCSNVHFYACSGNDVGVCCRVMNGGIITIGGASASSIPHGNFENQGGYIYSKENVSKSGSWNYPNTSTLPNVPSTGVEYIRSYTHTSLQSYQYNWSNWSTDGSCKQGAWGNLSPYVKKLA